MRCTFCQVPAEDGDLIPTMVMGPGEKLAEVPLCTMCSENAIKSMQAMMEEDNPAVRREVNGRTATAKQLGKIAAFNIDDGSFLCYLPKPEKGQRMRGGTCLNTDGMEPCVIYHVHHTEPMAMLGERILPHIRSDHLSLDLHLGQLRCDNCHVKETIKMAFLSNDGLSLDISQIMINFNAAALNHENCQPSHLNN